MKSPSDTRDTEANDDTILYADEAAAREPTPEEKAEQARLRLEEKQRRADEGVEAMREYLAEADAVREKTARLRALRLAREAELAAAEAKAAKAAARAAKAKTSATASASPAKKRRPAAAAKTASAAPR